MHLQTTTDQTQVDKILQATTRSQPEETDYLFKIVFGIYMLVSVVVLINLLIAMMSDTYQRIQVYLTEKQERTVQKEHIIMDKDNHYHYTIE